LKASLVKLQEILQQKTVLSIARLSRQTLTTPAHQPQIKSRLTQFLLKRLSAQDKFVALATMMSV